MYYFVIPYGHLRMNLTKTKRYTHQIQHYALILILCISVLAPFLLHYHHIHTHCNEPEIGHSEEFCPVCWFLLQLNTIAFWIINFAFILLIKVVVQTKNNLHLFSFLSLYLSRAPPLTN